MKKDCVKKFNSFTLAEMMVVMLILTIILAAFAPLMTKRKNVDLSSSPWRYTEDSSGDIYYGLAGTQTAMIGQNKKGATEGRLQITANESIPLMAFTTNGDNVTTKANLMLFGQESSQYASIFMGGPYSYINVNEGNTAFGTFSLTQLTQGGNNTAVGDNALYNTTTGSNNTAIGEGSLFKNNAGSDNTAIGFQACRYVQGSNKTCIGAGSGPDSSLTVANDTSNMVYIGTADSTVYIPGNLVVGQSVYLNTDNNSARTTIRADETGLFNTIRKNADTNNTLSGIPANVNISNGVIPSDRRLKNVGKPFTSGLEALRDLPLYHFTFKNDKEKTPQVGVMAQDLQKIFPDAVKKDDNGYLLIRKDEMFYAMINSIKQLDTLVQGIINEIKVVYQKLKVLENENKELRTKNKELEKRLEALEKKF